MEPTAVSPDSAPEQSPDRGKAESLGQPEAAPAAAAASSTPVAPVPATASPSAPADNSAQQQQSPGPTVTGPATAADVDVIEKEWVDKAEQVIEKTAGNPRAEEEQVEDLQVDYLKKRYNKDIKKSSA